MLCSSLLNVHTTVGGRARNNNTEYKGPGGNPWQPYEDSRRLPLVKAHSNNYDETIPKNPKTDYTQKVTKGMYCQLNFCFPNIIL